MPSTIIEAVVQLAHISGIPRDRDNNVFHFLSNGDDVPGDIEQIFDALEDFYTSAAGHTLALQEYMSGALSQVANAHQIKAYTTIDFDGSSPLGSPEAIRDFTLNVPAANPLPNEVAVVLSFHGDLTGILETSGATRPRARRRGRIFFGPLNFDGVVELDVATGEVLVDDANIGNDLASAGAELAQSMNGLAGAPAWVVWSKTNASVFPVVGGHVDNAFDTQRRRGQKATGRTLWSV